MIWQGVNRNLLKLKEGKPKFAQITGVNRNFFKLHEVKFVIKVYNRKIFKLQGRNPNKIFYRGNRK